MTAPNDEDQREQRRLAELSSYRIAGSDPEPAFDDLVRAAAAVAGTPAAAISLVDEHRRWYQASVGLGGQDTPRDTAFCDLVVQDEAELIVDDTLLEPRLADNPDVTGGPRHRFYAGFPLRTPTGAVLGSLCVIDQQPGRLTGQQIMILRILADQVLAQLQLRRELQERDRRPGFDPAPVQANHAAGTGDLLEMAQELAGIGSWSVDLRTDEVVWTREAHRILGTDPSLALSKNTYLELIDPADHAAIEAAIGIAFAAGRSGDVEFRLNRPGGQQRLIRGRYRVDRDAGGRPARLSGTILDVTEAREIEQELHRARDLLEQVMSSATKTAVIGIGSDGLINVFNRGAENLLGYSAEEMVGTQGYLHFHDSAEYIERAATYGLSPASRDVFVVAAEHGDEWTYICKDGRRLRCSVSVSRMTDAHGNDAGLLGFTTDVTQARLTQQELVEARDLFEQLLASATEQAIICTDLTGTITIFNRGAERLLGYPAAEMVGTTARPILAPGDQRVIEDRMGQIRDGAAELHYDSAWIRQDGTALTVAVVLTPMRRHDGELVGFVVIAADVTEQRRHETDLVAANARVMERDKQMEEAQQLAGVGSWSLDLRTGDVVWSRELHRIFGLDPESATITADTFRAHTHPDDIARVDAESNQSLVTGEPYEYQHWISAADGQDRLIMSRGRAELDENGRAFRLSGAIQDITRAHELEADLVRANDLFNQLLSSATEQAIIGTDTGGLVNIFNRGAEIMLGYHAEEIAGQPADIFHDPDEMPALLASLQRLSDVDGAGADVPSPHTGRDWTYIRQDGRRLQVQIRFSAMRDPDGQIVGFVGVTTDVTQQRRSEAALAHAVAEVELRSEQLEEAQELAAVGSWSYDFATEVTLWSRELFRICAAETDALAPGGDAFWQRVHPQDRPQVEAVLQQARGSQDAWSIEHRMLLPSGQVKEILNRGRIEVDDQGTVTRMRGIVQDITETRRIERELLAARDQFVQLLGAATDQAIVGTGTDGKINLFNKGAERMLGYTAEEAFGATPENLLHDQAGLGARSVPAETGHRSLADGQVDGQRQWVWVSKDGRRLEVQISHSPMRDEHGNVSGTLAIATDVTEQREAERARDRAERDVRVALTEISQARDQALAANQAKSAFLATMSHEIRTPMNAVIGMTGLLLDTGLDEDQRDLLETVRGSGDQLLAIINDILDFSKIEAGDLDLEYRSFDLRDLVEGTVAQFAGSAQGLDLLSQVDDSCPAHVIGDVTRLRQVLSNLISNAIKFTAAGEVFVHVTGTEREDDQVGLVFRVRDTGIGIPAESLHRLFKSFSQVDASTTRNFGGTGLGLAISRALVTAMGGEIWVESAPGEGSTFSFTVLAGADDSAPQPVPGRMDATALRAALTGRRVLIVDDNATNRQILTRQLRGRAMDTVEASTPVEALRLLTDDRQHVDLAVLDFGLPVLDGVQLAQAIGRMPQRAGMPLVLLSSFGRRLGADEHLFAAVLTKPARSASLLEAIARALSAPVAAGSADRTVRPLVPRSARAQDDEGPRPVQPGSASAPALGILFAEDNEVNQKVGRLMLAKLGHSVEIVGNGQEALAAAHATDYDVILMDMHMPVMDGLEATRRIRAELPPDRQPRIVAMTASVTIEDRQACSAAGMDGYLSKPVRPDDLAAALTDVQAVTRE